MDRLFTAFRGCAGDNPGDTADDGEPFSRPRHVIGLARDYLDLVQTAAGGVRGRADDGARYQVDEGRSVRPIDPDALKAELRRIAPRASLETIERFALAGRGPLNGAYYPAFRGIVVAATAPNPMQTLRHEAIHALRDLNLIRPEEWRRLAARAEAEWIGRYDIETRYPSLTREGQIEEAVAEAFADHAETPLPPGLRSVWENVKRFLDRLGAWLRGQGFQTAEDVLGRIESGEVGARDVAPGQGRGTAAAFQERPAPSRARSRGGMQGAEIDAPADLYEWLGIDRRPFFADYGYLQRKHPEYFATPEAARDHVLGVLDNAAVAFPSEHPGHETIVWQGDPDRIIAIELALRGRRYAIVSAMELKPGQLERKLEGVRRAGREAEILTAEELTAPPASDPGANAPQEEIIPSAEDDKGDAKFQTPRLREDEAPAPVLPAQRSRSVLDSIKDGQPIDRILRLPFRLFGGVTERGEWKPGLRLADWGAEVATERKLDPDGRFAWLNPAIEKARAGLIDRYGQDPEYVARDRQRQNEETTRARQGLEIVRGLVHDGMDANEAAILQAVLTGEPRPRCERVESGAGRTGGGRRPSAPAISSRRDAGARRRSGSAPGSPPSAACRRPS